MTLDKPILWGSNYVSIIILIAISEFDVGRIKQVLSRLLVILESKEFIEKLSKVNQKKEIIEMIKEIM